MSQSVAQGEVTVLIGYASVPITSSPRTATLVASNAMLTALAPYLCGCKHSLQ